jgi:hypothetical protein
LALGGLLVASADKWVHAAMGAEAQTAALDRALTNAHIPVKAFEESLKSAESQGHKFGFSNNEVREALTKLVTATGDSKKAIFDLGIAEDLARFKHLSLQQASDTLTRAVAGSSQALKQLGIDVPKVTTHMDALRLSHMKTGTAAYFHAKALAEAADKAATGAARMQALNEKLHGQAAAFSETTAGKIQTYNAEMENLKEKLGAGLLPILGSVVDKLSSFADFMSRHTTLAKGLVIALGGLAVSLMAVGVAGFIAGNLMTLGIGGAVVAVAAGITLLITHFDQVKAALSSLGAWIQGHAYVLLAVPIIGPFLAAAVAVHGHLAQIHGAVTTTFNEIHNTVVATMNAVTGAFRAGWATAVSIVRATIATATAAATAVGHGIVTGITTGLSALRGAVTTALHAIGAALATAAKAAFSEAAAIGHSIISGVLSGLGGLVSSVAGKIQSGISSALHAVTSHIPHFSPLTHAAAEAISQPIIAGTVQGLRPIQSVLTRTLQNAIGRSLLAAHIGFVGAKDLLVDPLATAKANADEWAETDGAENMQSVGTMLGRELIKGFVGATSFAGALGTSVLGSPTGGQLSPVGAGVFTGGSGGSSGGMAEIHTHVYLDGKQITETVRKELWRIAKRNGNNGATTLFG